MKHCRKSTLRIFEMNKAVQHFVLVPESCVNVDIRYEDASMYPNMHH